MRKLPSPQPAQSQDKIEHQSAGGGPDLRLARSVQDLLAALGVALLIGSPLSASPELLQTHCADCHNPDKAKGKFQLKQLGASPSAASFDRWVNALEYVETKEMPPEEDSTITGEERRALARYLNQAIRGFDSSGGEAAPPAPRRLNNREFANSVRDALLLEDVGTQLPVDNLIGDTLHHGFDTHGPSLGFSNFHLEQFLESVRTVVDATILEGPRPESTRIVADATGLQYAHLRQNSQRPVRYGTADGIDLRDPKTSVFLRGVPKIAASGQYRLKVQVVAKDRTVYDTRHTGFYHGDPIRFGVHLGDRVQGFELPDEEIVTLELEEWIAAGTVIEFRHHSDAFALRANGNFKFQYAIEKLHREEYEPEALADFIQRGGGKSKRTDIDHWSHWTEQWRGGRPRILRVEVEGPFYESWPPSRTSALLGDEPSVAKARQILRPIAERAWRRTVAPGELAPIVALVESKAGELGEIGALKEGIVALLVSPEFLLHDRESLSESEWFAAKLSYLLQSTFPSDDLRSAAASGRLDSFESVHAEIARQLTEENAMAFLDEFPQAWLELDDINFMAPDPERYRFYHRKQVSEDMINEVKTFFRHAVKENLPIPELLTAEYSFINADLAQVYGVRGIPEDSILRRHVFADGKRGGLLGMGAFLTATADTNSTSPIHRAVYVMENFLGTKPTPPPPGVEITEPDVRQAKTIKEVLAAHTKDETCASCHRSIDPWGYAFENFGPDGGWRDSYEPLVPGDVKGKGKGPNLQIPIDASATFRSGDQYDGITEFRAAMRTSANRERFVRCFIEKLLLYANGVEPSEADYVAIDDILAKSAKHEYRIVETVAAVADSPLFRQR